MLVTSAGPRSCAAPVMFPFTQTQHVAGTARKQSLGNNLMLLKGPPAVQVAQL